jgi:photosystem II stability/assembly factor-like uncharacterized protein
LSPLETINSIQFTDLQHGCVGTENGISYTADGGASWTSVLYGPVIKAIKMVSPSKGYAVGEMFNGVAYRTVDGGLTWNNIMTLSIGPLNAISTLGEDTFYVSGRDFRTYYSTNQGGTWFELYNGRGDVNGEAFLIHFSSFGNGFVSGIGGNYRYWSTSSALESTDDFGYTLNGVSYYGNDGFIVGANSVLKLFPYTGTSSTPQKQWQNVFRSDGSTFPYLFKAVHYATADALYVVGENGVVVRLHP